MRPGPTVAYVDEENAVHIDYSRADVYLIVQTHKWFTVQASCRGHLRLEILPKGP